MNPTTLADVESWNTALEAAALGEMFAGPPFLRPFHFALMASAAHRKGASFMTVPERVKAYAARMRLWQAVGLESPTTVNERNPGGKFHPLTPITSEESAEVCADAVTAVFRQAGTSDKRTLDSIGIMLSEIFGNCHFHSRAPGAIEGLACAQTWPAGNLAQVAVADTGVGIRESLSANPALAEALATRNANELATELGVTGKPAGEHSGYGLAVARQLMEKHAGRLLVLSGDEAFVAKNGAHHSRKLACRVVGTVVIMEWQLSTPMDIGRVYGSWPDAGEDDDYF